jgi:hypothetical protein
MLPTFDEFVAKRFPNNSYIDHDEFDDLYIRKGNIIVNLKGELYECQNVITIANIHATKPGTGAFTRFTKSLIDRGYAIYVECVQNGKFAKGLEKHGYVRINLHNEGRAKHYLFNFEGHLKSLNQPQHSVSSV